MTPQNAHPASNFRMNFFPVLSLPQGILDDVIDEVLCQSGGAEGALRGLRRTCRKLRAAANTHTRSVSRWHCCIALQRTRGL